MSRLICSLPVRHEVEEREVKARMDRPHVKVVEEMGVSRDLIMTVIRKRLLEKGMENIICKKVCISLVTGYSPSFIITTQI